MAYFFFFLFLPLNIPFFSPLVRFLFYFILFLDVNDSPWQRF